ncbi:RING/FYVE/PHD zinc finger-containing protein [Dorcoceras hygrometricum]|uniref:RING/FYVE/PHD zinc finger-containing protein n=1 Tax=Dorcoceras hygrometricum TaxID=472368 RepID=A0A2Z7B381_9LAMI|nr:RING/FYVE/PHD zinc finger-containing protein [Dorcoceras hygrometricum]
MDQIRRKIGDSTVEVLLPSKTGIIKTDRKVAKEHISSAEQNKTEKSILKQISIEQSEQSVNKSSVVPCTDQVGAVRVGALLAKCC